MRNTILAVFSLLALPQAAYAASFPCSKAGTPTEKAICSTPALSQIDERMAAAYKEAIQFYSGIDGGGSTQAAVKTDQRAWLKERNGCGADTACLADSYEQRIRVLTFQSDADTAPSAGRFVGAFDHDDFIGIRALALRDGSIAVNVSGADPVSARWVCDFSGIGRVEHGRLLVGAPDLEGNGLILEPDGANGIVIAENEVNRAASRNWCGMNGSFMFPYVRDN
jgi:uncharacterized protein